MLFGGRIAEEMFMHQMTTGASNDFERATEIARRMVTQWGMSDALGPMVYGENEGEVFLGRSITTHKNVSETTLQKVDAEIRRIIDEQYKLARQLHRGEPRQGRGHGQGAARMGDARRRPARRHHGRQAAARRPSRRRASSTPSAPDRRRAGRRRARPPALAEIGRLPPSVVLRCGGFLLPLDRPLIMGVVNVTPDSFSDGGKFLDPQAAIAHGRRLIEEGADILDIGGESSRPGAQAVAEQEELRARAPGAESPERRARFPWTRGGRR